MTTMHRSELYHESIIIQAQFYRWHYPNRFYTPHWQTIDSMNVWLIMQHLFIMENNIWNSLECSQRSDKRWKYSHSLFAFAGCLSFLPICIMASMFERSKLTEFEINCVNIINITRWRKNFVLLWFKLHV